MIRSALVFVGDLCDDLGVASEALRSILRALALPLAYWVWWCGDWLSHGKGEPKARARVWLRQAH